MLREEVYGQDEPLLFNLPVGNYAPPDPSKLSDAWKQAFQGQQIDLQTVTVVAKADTTDTWMITDTDRHWTYEARKGDTAFSVYDITVKDQPYAVTESNAKVRLIQPKGDQRYAVLFVYSNETISYHYERNPTDPRIEHNFTVEVDPYGNVTKSCHVFYPRRKPATSTTNPADQLYDEQTQRLTILFRP